MAVSKVYGLLDPVNLNIASGAKKSQRCVIGQNTVVGLWVTGYADKLYINASDSLTSADPIPTSNNGGRLIVGTVVETSSSFAYAKTQVFGSADGTRYSEIVGSTDKTYLAIDWRIFLGVPCIEIELDSAAGSNLTVGVVLYQKA